MGICSGYPSSWHLRQFSVFIWEDHPNSAIGRCPNDTMSAGLGQAPFFTPKIRHLNQVLWLGTHMYLMSPLKQGPI